MQEIEAIVSGKVQGVGFREFTARHARALWLYGFVENRGVGELYVIAQGSEEKLKKLIQHLHKGPFLARVRDVSVVWREPVQQFSDFSVQ